ncbi:2Fe-2S iron-sulfur cluster-binding protein, partial [Rhizobium sp. BR5]
IDLLKHTPFSLTEEEKADGLTLACRAVPLSDMTISWLDGDDEIADIPTGRFEGVVVEVVDATHDIKLIRI